MKYREVSPLLVPAELYHRLDQLAQRQHGPKADVRAFLVQVLGEVATALEREYAQAAATKSRLVLPPGRPLVTVGPLITP